MTLVNLACRDLRRDKQVMAHTVLTDIPDVTLACGDQAGQHMANVTTEISDIHLVPGDLILNIQNMAHLLGNPPAVTCACAFTYAKLSPSLS